MIALISIPHQTPPRLHWYENRTAVENAAFEYALESNRPEPEGFEASVACLCDDWNGCLLVESAADIEYVADYKGHQEHRIRPMVEELREEFGN